MSKKAKVVDDSTKPLTLKRVAEHLAASRKRLADAEAKRDKLAAELDSVVADVFMAGIEVAAAEFDFDELAIEQARKRFGLPEDVAEPGLPDGCSCCSGVTFTPLNFSEIAMGCPPRIDTGSFTFSIKKPDHQLQREMDEIRYVRGLGK